jgi:hypothetical protein
VGVLNTILQMIEEDAATLIGRYGHR